MHLSKTHWKLINTTGLILLALVITDPFEMNLLLQDTVLTGGDAGSWYQIATHLKESLLPNWRLFGWDQGNFFGYPNLQHYFVLPFLFIVLLSFLIPLTISLKIVSIIGLFALPFVVYWSLRKLQYKDPVPLTGAWVMLGFLFHERYSMFGGNLLSNLAGEFCYSIAFTLLIIFLTFIITDFKQQKLSVRSGVLLGLIGLTHAFVFFVAILIPLYFFIFKPNRQMVKNILLVYGMGFLIMAFWVLPMLSNHYYTTPININWRFPQPMEFLTTIHWQTMLVTLSVSLLLFFKSFKTYEGVLYLYLIICSVGLYLIASSLQIPDIRFFPPILFFSLLLIIDGSSSILKHLTIYKNIASFSILGLGILFGGSYVYSKNNIGPEWFNSNFAGYEAQKAFLDGSAKRLFNTLEGTYNDPRVAWEQGRHDLSFGTMRFFENIPLFTGRASTEGIHYASALLSLPITILNSEYSKIPGSPSPNIYSHYYIDSLAERFRMLHIRDFIAYSPEITQLIKDNGEFDTVTEETPYTIFKLKNYTGQYVESPKYSPLLTEDYKDWKFRFTNWFRRGENLDLTLINGYLASPESKNIMFSSKPVILDAAGRIDNYQKVAIEPATISNIDISNYAISFKTDKPRTPHIIKIAYSPLWQSFNDEEIFMIAPGFMLIYPDTTYVTIYYSRHWIELVGLLLTISGIFLTIYLSLNKVILTNFLNLKIIEKWSSFLLVARKPILFVLSLLTIMLSILSYFEKQAIYSDYMSGNKAMEENNINKAINYYKNNSTIENITRIDNTDIPTSIYALARAYRNIGKNDLAKIEFKKLIDYYPRWIFIDEIYWHLGSIAVEQNRLDEATTMFNNCLKFAKFGEYKQMCSENLNKITL